MTIQSPAMNEQHVVRHYRAATRAEIEQAYRADAARAGRAGYVPVAHSWSHDDRGLLLAVTYGPEPGVATKSEPTLVAVPVEPDPAHPQRSQPGQPITGSSDEFSAEPRDTQRQQFAPAPTTNDHVTTERYSPPPEMYLPPPDLYVQVAGESVEVPAWDEPAAEAQIESAIETEAEPAIEATHEPEVALEPEPAAWVEPEATPEPEPAAWVEPEVTPEPEPTPAEAHVAAPVPSPQPARPERQALLTIQTMDLHVAGEPLRIIRSGFPDVPLLPVLERREWVRANADHVRRALMHEPRGHRDMYGAILLPPHSDYADMTVLFMHNEGYSTMCGHGIIGITTALIEEGLFPAAEPLTTIRYEVPAGVVAANAATVRLEDGSWAVRGVRFTNVPSYLAAQSLSVRPDGIELFGTAAQYGALGVDLAFGGAYYGIVNAAELGLRVVPEQADALRRAGAAITEVLRRDQTPAHPTDPELSFVYGTIIVDLDPRSSPDGRGGRAHIRNATIFADAELDRSPCGSGTSAILAQLHARGRMRAGQELVNAGITGEHFLGRIEAETTLGPYPAVSTSIAGTAFITGHSTFVVDSRDPLGEGFLLS